MVEAAEQSRRRPVEQSRALAFALAFLWAYAGGERWPYDNFWKSIAGGNDIGRWQGVNASLNAIFRAHGLTRPDQ